MFNLPDLSWLFWWAILGMVAMALGVLGGVGYAIAWALAHLRVV